MAGDGAISVVGVIARPVEPEAPVRVSARGLFQNIFTKGLAELGVGA